MTRKKGPIRFWGHLLLVFCLALFNSSTVQAFQSGGFTGSVGNAPVGMGSMITGYCSGGPFPTPMDIANVSTWSTNALAMKLDELNKSLREGMKQTNGYLHRVHEDQVQKDYELEYSKTVAEEHLHTFQRLGESGTPRLGCGCTEQAAGVQVGKKAERLASKNVYNHMQTHNTKWQTQPQLYKRYSEIPASQLNGELLFPHKGTLSAEEVLQAETMVQTISNPFPELNLNETQGKTPAGKQYELYRKAKASQLAIPQRVMADHVASMAPTMELGDWVADTYAEMGGQGTPDIIQDGKVSPSALLDFMVDQFFSNPNWYEEVMKKNEYAGQKYQLMMTALGLEIERRQMKSLQQIALLLAQQEARNTGQAWDAALAQKYSEANKQSKQ